MISTIDPRYEIRDDGIWVRREYTYSMTDEVYAVYGNNRIEDVIRVDANHYQGFYATFKLQIPQLFKKHYDICYAFGGGAPKLEALLNIDKIKVIDGMVDKYIEHEDLFRKWHGFAGELEYEQLIFDSNKISRYPYDKNSNIIVSFIHILEHQNLDEHLAILKELPKNTDILIYGPNVARYKFKGWVHGQDWILDHNTFIPYKKFQEILIDMKYEIYFSAEYSDDLLFYFNTGDKWN